MELATILISPKGDQEHYPSIVTAGRSLMPEGLSDRTIQNRMRRLAAQTALYGCVRKGDYINYQIYIMGETQ